MTHNSRCANAKGPKCECSCGGKWHGTGVTLPLPPPYFGTPSLWIPSTKSRYLCIPMGGTVAQMIRQFLGEKFTCTCGHTIKIKEFIGYPDKYGYPDGSGHTWEIYIICPNCKRWWIMGEIPIRRSIRLIPEAKRLPIVLKSYVEECVPQFELQEEDGYFLLISRDCPLSQGITSKTPTCGEIASALEYCVEWITGQKHEVKEIECKATGHPADVFMVEEAATV
ncbi:MAG: hypothetical protein AYK19_12485 [Theionarchaea archaeon DG-70-1]|nr:MAG: hypothetical protein AYK19_12485 [Theionarchaea archaeon DG-70-1]